LGVLAAAVAVVGVRAADGGMLAALALADKDLGQLEAAVDQLFGIAVIHEGDALLAEFVGEQGPGLVGELARIEGGAILQGGRRALEALRPVRAWAAVSVAIPIPIPVAVTIPILRPGVAILGVRLALWGRIGAAVTVAIPVAVSAAVAPGWRALVMGLRRALRAVWALGG
jgi:hypothetical protein